jgi:hypothetical protein
MIKLSHPFIVKLLEKSSVLKDLLHIKFAWAPVRSALDWILAGILVHSVKLGLVSEFLLLTFGEVLSLRCSRLLLICIHRSKELIFSFAKGVRLVKSHCLSKLRRFPLFYLFGPHRCLSTWSTASWLTSKRRLILSGERVFLESYAL